LECHSQPDAATARKPGEFASHSYTLELLIFRNNMISLHNYPDSSDRKSRTDLSLFQLGLSLLDYLFGKRLRIPVGFSVPLAILKSVWW